MRALFFTDIHGSEKYLQNTIDASKDADIIVCAGDLTIFENNLDGVLRRLNSVGKPCLVIHGNHESASSMQIAASRYKNIRFLHKTFFVKDDVVFFGYGGGGFNTRDEGFDKAAETFMKDLRKIAASKIVLVTHAPPSKTLLDNLGEGRTDWHVGCENFTEFIKKYHPIVAVSGHIHESFGLSEKIGDTLIINPGPQGKIIDI